MEHGPTRGCVVGQPLPSLPFAEPGVQTTMAYCAVDSDTFSQLEDFDVMMLAAPAARYRLSLLRAMLVWLAG